MRMRPARVGRSPALQRWSATPLTLPCYPTECDLSFCDSCISTSTTCLTCASSSSFATPIGTCVSTCPGGSYLPNSSSRSCAPCPGDCATCSADPTTSNSSAQCLSCPSTRPVLRNGRCMEVCPSGQYWNAGTSTCETCSVGCTSCIGPTPTECLSCAEGSALKAGACQQAACAADGWVDVLGVCLTALIDTGGTGGTPTWWPYILAVGIAGVVAGTIFAWWIRRERRRTRERTREFGDTLDDAEVGKKLNLLRLGRLGRSKHNQDHSPPSLTDSPRSARFFTFLSARSPPASPLSEGRSKNSASPSPRTSNKLKSFQLGAERESFSLQVHHRHPPIHRQTTRRFLLSKSRRRRSRGGCRRSRKANRTIVQLRSLLQLISGLRR